MSKPIILVARQGWGKTRNAEALRTYFKCRHVEDMDRTVMPAYHRSSGAAPWQPKPDTLYITHDEEFAQRHSSHAILVHPSGENYEDWARNGFPTS